MNFIQSDLGYQNGGEVVEVTLDKAANVQLLDSVNFSNYKQGQKFRYHGGHVTRSPYRMTIPHSGHWYVAIDLGGYPGNLKASVQVLPGRLPVV